MAQLAREVVLGSTSSLIKPEEFTQILSPRAWPSQLLESTDVETAPLLYPSGVSEPEHIPTEQSGFSKRVRFGINASWVVNVLLLFAKAVAFVLSGSYAVLSSAVDSLVDVLSQAVLAVAEYQAARFDQRFPIGRTRMAELSVLACAAIMFVSTVLVIREAIGSIWDGIHGRIPELTVDAVLFGVLGSATAFKLALYIYCRVLRKNPIMVALSEDHLNDVMSNVAAVGGAAVAGNLPRCWWVDPAVALLFSLLIIRNWLAICWEQGQKMIGLGAPEELIDEVSQVTRSHHPAMKLDRVTAYHHGSHMVVEVEVVMPPTMTVRESHDIALALQHKIEALDSVERAFVHVDYAKRSLEEHKVERNLKLGVKDVMAPLPGYDYGPGSPGALGATSPPAYGHRRPGGAAGTGETAASSHVVARSGGGFDGSLTSAVETAAVAGNGYAGGSQHDGAALVGDSSRGASDGRDGGAEVCPVEGVPV